MQRAVNERRAALEMPIRNPEDADPDRSQPSTATDYFDNMSGVALDVRWIGWNKRGRKECNLVTFTQNSLDGCSRSRSTPRMFVPPA
ncbi:hypothetical protein DY000_02031978 [Brassica cretica]|uniref:Uncharacterized protein n=1 Tax=Brassica cretica TaxID=69181 RepID=A0ABQ7DXU6_BRACR|nr:hypothetical protein DY000_02031978 [Brassica cretica]